MTGDFVQHFASLLRGSSATELTYSDSNFRVVLKRNPTVVPSMLVVNADGGVKPERAEVGAIKVKSPATGKFIGLHPLIPGPVVEVGSYLSEGDVIGYLQIDGVLSCVRATASGRVVSVDIADGDIAGFEANLLSLVG